MVLTGVHGDEGLSSSTLLCDAIGRWVSDGADPDLPDDAAVLMVHAVNPWGMTFWRRQNESNVDLNRNWGRDERTGESNRMLARVVGDRLGGADEVLVVDLHTGHGDFGTYTMLSHVEPDPDDASRRCVRRRARRVHGRRRCDHRPEARPDRVGAR